MPFIDNNKNYYRFISVQIQNKNKSFIWYFPVYTQTVEYFAIRIFYIIYFVACMIVCEGHRDGHEHSNTSKRAIYANKWTFVFDQKIFRMTAAQGKWQQQQQQKNLSIHLFTIHLSTSLGAKKKKRNLDNLREAYKKTDDNHFMSSLKLFFTRSSREFTRRQNLFRSKQSKERCCTLH